MMSKRERKIRQRPAPSPTVSPGRSADAPSPPTRRPKSNSTRARILVLDQAFAELSHVPPRDNPAEQDVADRAAANSDLSARDANAATLRTAVDEAADLQGPQQALASRTTARLDAVRQQREAFEKAIAPDVAR